jgi:hypothetical protein
VTHAVDLVVIVAYLVAIAVIGLKLSGASARRPSTSPGSARCRSRSRGSWRSGVVITLVAGG